MNNLKLASVALLTLQWMFFCPLTPPLAAQSTPKAATPPAPVIPTAAQPPLAREQQEVAERLGRLETLLLRSADLEAGENPARAALLQQAVQLSKQAELPEVLAAAAARLEQGQLSEAIEKQKVGRENLKRLLELLQSENREQRIREERDEVRRWIEETDRLLRLQSSLRGRTEGGQDTQQSAQDQQKLADKADDIAAELKGDSKAAEESPQSQPPGDQKSSDKQPADKQSADKQPDGKQPDGKSSDGKSSDGKKTDGKPSDGKPAEGEPSDDKPADDKPSEDMPAEDKPAAGKPTDDKPTDDKPSEGKPTDGKPTDGKPTDGKPTDGKPTDGQQPSEQQPSDGPASESSESSGQPGQPGSEQPPQAAQSPTERAKQKIEQAKQNMQEAQQQLEEAQRDGAVEKQRAAEERLREAIEELEEILRQLREEEVERSLASLETRLRRMLEMQNKVLEETRRLQEITGEGANRQVQIAASKLSQDERKILAEGERAHLLLREEGSSAAFPEAIEQLNMDIASVTDRLTAGDVGQLTVNIEQEIVQSLEEMVEALVQVQKDNQKKQQQQQQGQPPPGGEPGDQPLVDKLAELRLIRTLQLRINNRTTTLSNLLADPNDPVGQTAELDIQQQLQDLAGRQSNIQQVTRHIVVGKGE
jgi:hypothetical protein